MYVRAANALTRLRECAGLSESSLVAYAISTKISLRTGLLMKASLYREASNSCLKLNNHFSCPGPRITMPP